ncbi:MAG: HEAT repeat domain-containing protein [Gemmataceae bacterium]
MNRSRIIAILAACSLVLALSMFVCRDRLAAAPGNWVWFNEGNPAAGAPGEARFFRKTFRLDAVPEQAKLEITADNGFTVWINEQKAGEGNQWQQLYSLDVKKHLAKGDNVIAVEARNESGPAGLVARLSYATGGKKAELLTDASWKAAQQAAPGWQRASFDDAKWTPVKVIGVYGKTAPWGGGAVAQNPKSPKERFTVPEGFKVEEAVKIPADDPRFSLVNMCFDAKGRLLVSREGGAILLCTQPDKQGVLQSVKPYCEQVKNCQGMCWVKDALLLVGNGPQGTGLYRVKDTDGDDKTDEVKLLHRFQGGMGEHGPHAILHGPDNWLYLVLGNHSWTRLGPKSEPNPAELASNSPLLRWPTGGQGPDQDKPHSTQDVLLPRQNDANGHAANILAPGGTIWRLDQDGQNMSLVAAGFRNQFDAAFSPTGELFTFDSDMEWDEALPWYRPVRVCFCPPGAEFGWRTGSSKIPPYALDTLPALVDTGRGSPVGVEYYDHLVFPDKYRTLYVADWAIGVIYAIHMERKGARFEATAEKFCSGKPMNVTDLAVAPDGSMVFTVGGRGTQGGVYRISYPANADKAKPIEGEVKGGAVPLGQPLSAWSRANVAGYLENAKGAKNNLLTMYHLLLIALEKNPERRDFINRNRIQMLYRMHDHDFGPDANLLLKPKDGQGVAPIEDPDPEVRAAAVTLLGIKGYQESKDALIKALNDRDALVRRRACEALIRAGFEPPLEPVAILLGDSDRFVRTAARLVLQRIDPKKWAGELVPVKSHRGLEAIVALCKIDRAEPYTEAIFERLHLGLPEDNVQETLDHLRTLQLALVHTKERPGSVRGIALECYEAFPHKDPAVNRELATVLTYFRKEGVIDEPVHAKLLTALEAADDDKAQQIHFFYCLRLLKEGWTAAQKQELIDWFESTRNWSGGASFNGFLANILRDASDIFTAEDIARILSQGEKTPRTTGALLRALPAGQLPVKTLAELHARLAKEKPNGQINQLKASIAEVLAQAPATNDNFPYLVMGLDATNPTVLGGLVQKLLKLDGKPKLEDGPAYRGLIVAGTRIAEKNRWQAVELLRRWSNNKQFGAPDGDWKTELTSWSKWFNQSFPKEPPLAGLTPAESTVSKHKYEDLLAFLESPAGKGDAEKGKLVFEKGQCIKCHKYGTVGEGIGPDLSAVAQRFKRPDMLESMYYPSKVISDQYRSSVIVTVEGQQFLGLAAPQGNIVTVLLQDGTRVALKKGDIEQQFSSLTSVMPEKLLDQLTREEIADLIAFMEKPPAK